MNTLNLAPAIHTDPEDDGDEFDEDNEELYFGAECSLYPAAIRIESNDRNAVARP